MRNKTASGRAKTRARTKNGRMLRKVPNARLKETSAEKKQRVEKIVAALEQAYPGIQLALNFHTPLELLIALILAAQCTDERVNQLTPVLFNKYRTPQDWAKLDRTTLEEEIRTTGFYRNKAKAIQECCRELISRFGANVPQQLEDLITLPGVGRKTANILRGNAFGQPAIGVDTHVGRLAQRLGLSTNTDPDKIEFDLNPLVPDEIKVQFCSLIQAHGRAICNARQPHCAKCLIQQLCPYPKRANIPLTKNA